MPVLTLDKDSPSPPHVVTMASSFSIHNTYGALFLGLCASAVLYGVTLLQTYSYFKQYPNDSRFTKFLVIVLWFFDTLHLILCIITIYFYLISNFNNPAALGKSNWSMNLQADCNGLIGLIVECFFARRVWRLSHNIPVTAGIVALACIHFSLGIVFTVDAFILVDVSKYGKLIWVSSLGLGSAAASDALIAAALCWYLTRSRTGFARTDSLITTLVAYSLTTGLLTGVLALLCVVLFAIMPTNYVWIAVFWPMGKCYINSFLAALNSREALLQHAAQKDYSLNLTPMSKATQSSGNVKLPTSPRSPDDLLMDDKHRGNLESQSMSVNIQTQTVTKTDFDYIVTPPSSTSNF